MTKGLIWALTIMLAVTISGYVFLKAEHVDGADTLAFAISSIIGMFVAFQNASLSKEVEKVKNQTNGMTHHIMKESEHLRRAKTLVEPADITEDSNNGRDHYSSNEASDRRSNPSRSRDIQRGASSGGRHSFGNTGQNGKAND